MDHPFAEDLRSAFNSNRSRISEVFSLIADGSVTAQENAAVEAKLLYIANQEPSVRRQVAEILYDSLQSKPQGTSRDQCLAAMCRVMENWMPGYLEMNCPSSDTESRNTDYRIWGDEMCKEMTEALSGVLVATDTANLGR